MHPGLPDAVDDVEADPAAVFEACGADSVDELVEHGAPTQSGESDATASDDAVGSMLTEGLADGSDAAANDPAAGRRGGVDAEAVGDALFPAIERHVVERSDDPTDDPVEASDDEVAAAIEAAEAIYEGDRPDTIPF